MMRITVADFGGYAFTGQLARQLARQGHHVLYTCLGDFQGPKSALGSDKEFVSGVTEQPVYLGEPFHKYNFLRRRTQERKIGRLFADQSRVFSPDIVICANMPLEAQMAFWNGLDRRRTAFVYWLQDISSEAMKAILGEKFGIAGRLVARYYEFQEYRMLRDSDAVVCITRDFVAHLPILRRRSNCHVIPNWAPLDELPVRAKDNAWSRKHDLWSRRVLLYSGTMGLKHNPNLIVRAAQRLSEMTDARIVVISEGLGAEYLARKKAELGLDNLLVLPFQPIRELPEVLAAADVLTAFIEESAGSYSVPSKMLTYLCAGRAVSAAVPASNLVSRMLSEERMGVVVSPSDLDGYARAVSALLADRKLQCEYGARARAYAETHFDIERIAARFEQICGEAVRGKSLHSSGAA